MVSISYAITVCNENDEAIRLINFLHRSKRPEDKIYVLLDKPKTTPYLLDYLYRFSSKDFITLRESNFRNDFAEWKNELCSMCKEDFIFNIDADEYPSQHLIDYLPQILEDNPEVKAYAVPRINTVEGLTNDHIVKWNWRVNEMGWVNFPDYQIRIFKNDNDIYWEGKVHERLNIWMDAWPLPMEDEHYVLYHPKTIERQEKQNNYYDTL